MFEQTLSFRIADLIKPKIELSDNRHEMVEIACLCTQEFDHAGGLPPMYVPIAMLVLAR